MVNREKNQALEGGKKKVDESVTRNCEKKPREDNVLGQGEVQRLVSFISRYEHSLEKR